MHSGQTETHKPSLANMLLVADGTCPQIRELLTSSITPVLWLDDQQAPLLAVSQALAKRRLLGQPVDTLHWLSHGNPGELRVGATRINRQTLLTYADDVASWGVNTLALWSCYAGAEHSFIAAWEELTGANVWRTHDVLGRLDDGSSNWSLKSREATAPPALPVAEVHLQAWPAKLAGSNPPTASGTPTLTAIRANATSPSGDTVANLFGPSFFDVDGHSLAGVAITANASTADQGSWDYSINNGSSWTSIPTTGLSDASALYLDSTARIRFLPAANFSGTPGALSARLIDNSTPPILSLTPFGITDVGDFSAPAFADIDGDDDLDAFIGTIDGEILYFRNDGDRSAPAFAAVNPPPFTIPDASGYAAPAFADIDGDGDLDLFIGDENGEILYFLNDGNRSAPSFAAAAAPLPTGITRIPNPDPQGGEYTTPAFGDIDGDGDLDAFFGDNNGDIFYFQNNGSPSAPTFSADTTNPFGITKVASLVAPAFADIDSDGDLDLFIGDINGNTVYFENVGNPSVPSFSAATTNPFGIQDVGFAAAPEFADIDGDGDLDAFIGNFDGNTIYFHNIGTSEAPTFIRGEPARTRGTTVDISSNTATDISAETLSLSTAVTTDSSVQASSSAPTSAAPIAPAVDATPADPAPAGTNIQPTDDDGDGIREVVTAADGTKVDGNRDGIADATQSLVAGLRLINDGAAGSEYGAISVSEGIQLQAVTLTAAETDGSIPITARSGGTLVISTPEGITNAFAGVVSFHATGVAPGGSTQATISFPTGLAAGSGNAYLRFNYTTNRFEEFLDANGNPLYAFLDSDEDGSIDSVVLTLTDGDPAWDGDGTANGTVVDPGFLASGARILNGTKRSDSLIGNVLANTLHGRKGNDWLVGDLGNDILKGSHGKDRLYGGEGADLITGGKDRDRIHYTSVSDSTTALRDTVKFGKGDRFVFRAFDGDTITEGFQTLTFIGKTAFSGTAGELRATRSVLEADTTGDGIADFAVNLRGNTLITANNLVL